MCLRQLLLQYNHSTLFLVIVVHLLCSACELNVIIGKCVYIRINKVCIRLDTIHGIRHLLGVLKYISPWGQL